MIKYFSPRPVFALIGFICIVFLTTAWYLQYGPGRQQPCPLCILQRYAYIALAITTLSAAAHGPRRVVLLTYAAIADLVAATGAGLALWQVSKGASMKSCLDDPIGTFVNGLPMANWWPEYFFANGGCADVFPPILGLHVPQWSLVWFTMFFIAITTLIVGILRENRAIQSM